MRPLRLTVALTAALVLLVIPAVGAGASPAAGAGSDWRTSAAERGPDGLRAAVVDGRVVHAPRTPLESLLRVRDHRDVGAWVAGAAARAGMASGLPAIGVIPQPTSEEDEDDWGWWPEEGSIASALPVGDLDGDGRADVLVADYDLGAYDAQLRAISGADGTELWRHPYGSDAGFALPLGRDIDGDGVEDLLRYTLHFTDFGWGDSGDGLPLLGGRTFEIQEDYVWGIALVSGADGATRWAREVPGTLTETFRDEGFLVEERGEHTLVATAYDVTPLLLDDDIALATLDIDQRQTYERRWTVVAEEDTYELTLSTSTALDVLDADGRTVRSLPAAPEEGVSFFAALGGADGDDLLRTRHRIPGYRVTCRGALLEDAYDCDYADAEGFGTDLEVLDGGTLTPRWSDEGAGFRDVLVIDDVDADGTADVLEVAFDDETGAVLNGLRSGSDGALRWQTDEFDDWLFPVGMDDFGGGGGRDLLTLAFEFGDSIGARVDRLDGRTGDVLVTSRFGGASGSAGFGAASGTTRTDPLGLTALRAALDDDPDGEEPPGYSAAMVYAGLAGALDAVPGADVAAGFSRYEERGEDWSETWESRLEGGATGAVLHAEGGDGFAYLFPLADLTGDGLPELERYRWSEDGETTEILAWPDLGTPLWSIGRGYVVPAGDHDGAAGEELLLSDTDWGADELETAIASLDGRTGAARWVLTSERAPQ